jgi:hypothetical protein
MFRIITFFNQQVECFKRHHTNLELWISKFLTYNAYNFNINTSNVNDEVGGQTTISKSVTLRTLVFFFEIAIQSPGARFQSLHTTNQQEFIQLRTKNALDYRCKLRPALKGHCVHFIWR